MMTWYSIIHEEVWDPHPALRAEQPLHVATALLPRRSEGVTWVKMCTAFRELVPRWNYDLPWFVDDSTHHEMKYRKMMWQHFRIVSLSVRNVAWEKRNGAHLAASVFISRARFICYFSRLTFRNCFRCCWGLQVFASPLQPLDNQLTIYV